MRVVSLLAAATEMIAELGCVDQLVGCSHECDYPAEIRQLPVVSKTLIDTNTSSAEIDVQVKQAATICNVPQTNALAALSVYTIDAQLLQRLQPDVIVTQTQCDVCAVSQEDVELALQQTIGLRPRIVALAPYDLQDVWQNVLLIGEALEREALARSLVDGYQRRLTRLKEQTQLLVQQAGYKPRVAVLEWLDPLMGAGNWTPDLVGYAGGENLFGTSGAHSPWINWEEFAAADPDVIVLAPCGYTLERTQQDIPLLQQHPGWQNLQAVKQGRVYAIDGNAYINRSGPRLVESAELLARAIWGSQLNIDVIADAYQQITN
ncbi:cobalamin-binding protein [Dictyobacter alpinus]|uniref:Cobalamin-binding protein n=2 Tax=Dictyobacter alpinus TaxID=2014873 RepID=A0A402BG83_9CHLR|nr:cobalamin-binding protein [Dictyobacter alpinus]